MLPFAVVCVLSFFIIHVKCQLKKEPLIIVPDSLVLGSTNKILVCASADATVKLFVKETSSTFYQTSVTISADSPITISIPPLQPAPNYLVTVDIIWSDFVAYVSKTFHIRSSSNVHLLQIETDKPQYRPSEEVKIRILPLARNYSVSTAIMSMTVLNPQGLNILTQRIFASHQEYFISFGFKLPYHQSDGLWKIIMKDVGAKTTIVLPNFQVVLLSDKFTFDNLNETFRFVVLARFPVGPSVSGALTVKCGTKQILNSQMVKGHFGFAFQLNQCFLGEETSSEVYQLLITAEVRDYGTGEKQNDTLKLYKVSNFFTLQAEPFKPGLNGENSFPVQISVASSRNQSVQNISLLIIPTCIKSRHQRIARTIQSLSDKTDDKGKIMFHIPVNANCLALMIEVSLNEQRLNALQNNRVTFLYPRIFDRSKGFIKIRKHHFSLGEEIEVDLITTRHVANSRRFNLLIICSSGYKHHEIISNKTIKLKTNVEMVPQCMLSLYAISTNGEISLEDVSKIIVSDACNKISIETMPNEIVFRPRQNITFQFHGARNGATAVTAIDQKVEFLFENYYHKIKPFVVNATQRELFDDLFETKLGEKIFLENLQKRQNESSNACCQAGHIWWQLQKACPTLNSTVSLIFLQKCQEKFFGCCSTIRRPTLEPACQQGFGQDCSESVDVSVVRTHGMKFSAHMQSSPGPPSVNDFLTHSRQYFPEVWIFEELYLSATNGNGYMTTSFPDSITNWTVHSQFYSPDQGICSKSVTLTTSQTIFINVDLPNEVFIGDQMLARITLVNLSPTDKNLIIVISRPSALCTEKPHHGDRSVYVPSMNSTTFHVPFEFLSEGEIPLEFTLKHHGEKKRVLDQRIEYKYVFNLSHPFIRGPIANEVFEFRSEVSNSSKSELTANFKTTDKIRRSRSFHSATLEITALQTPTSSRSMVTNNDRLKPELRYQVENSAFLNDLLRTIPVLMKIVNQRMHIELNDKILLKSKALLQYALVELLSFRNDDGSFSSVRKDRSKQNLWLSLLATLIQCVNGVDESIINNSMDFIMNEQLNDGRFPSDSSANSFMANGDADKTLFASVFAITLNECNKYCSSRADYQDKVKKSLNFLKTVDSQQADSVVLATVTLALAKWKVSSSKLYKDAFFARLDKTQDSSRIWPYQPQSSSWYSPLKHGLSSFWSSSYRKKMLANQILLNSCGVLIQNEFEEDKKIDLSDVLSWLYRAQYADGAFVSALDTYFASEAIQMEEMQKKSSVTFGTVATITVYCDSTICHNLKLDSMNDELTKIISMNSKELINLTIIASGTGVFSAKFRLISTLSNPFLKDYPVKIINRVKKYSNGSGQELCFTINDSSISTLAIEHGLLVEHVAQLRSFRMKTGNVSYSSLELTSDALHIQFDNLKPYANYCYYFETSHGPGSRVRVTKSSPVMLARHNELGVVGMKMMYKTENAPLLEKYCPNDEQCFCLETGCPLHNGRCDSMCPDPNNVIDNSQSLFHSICHRSNYGALIKINQLKNEIYHYSDYNVISATVHIEFPSKELNLTEIIILKKSTCSCPFLEINRFYFLIVNVDQVSRTLDEFNDKPLVVVGKHSIFEPSFTSKCAPQRQLDIMKLTEKSNYNTFCSRFVN